MPTRGKALTLAALLLAKPLFGQDKLPKGFRPEGQLETIREEFVQPAGHGNAEAVTAPVPALREGIPDATLCAAERFAASRNSVARGSEAIDLVRREIGRYPDAAGAAEGVDVGSPETIIIASATIRPALRVCADAVDQAVPADWFGKFSPRRQALTQTLRSVGLVTQRPGPGFQRRGLGTAFVVAPGILMTNRHVAEIFTVPDGVGGWEIVVNPFTGQPQEISINFVEDHCGNPASLVRVAKVLHIEPEHRPDVALLEVDGNLPPPLPLQREALDASNLPDRDIYVAGYPFNDPRNPLWARLEVFGDIFGVKRLAPGALQELSGQTLADMNAYLLHDASTLGGNSGNPVVDLETNTVIGLHFSGTFQEANFARPMWRVLEIPAVKAALATP